MMKPKEHANLLSIFFWIFAGIQSLMFLLILVYAGFMGFVIFMAAQENQKDAEPAIMIVVVIIAGLSLLLLFGLASIITNITAGYGLRNGKAWAGRLATVASILSVLSFLCGGIVVMPFGIAVGVYGLWFIFGDAGKYYFAGEHLSPVNQNTVNMNTPYQPNNWQ